MAPAAEFLANATMKDPTSPRGVVSKQHISFLNSISFGDVKFKIQGLTPPIFFDY
jgi:hypothetical protein